MRCLPKYIQQVSVWRDEVTVHCAPPALLPVLTFLRDHTAGRFKQCQDVCGVDYPHRTQNRFEVVHHLLSIDHNCRLRVKTYASEQKGVPSACSVHPGANWFEREAYDMYGILFYNHPDLRRLLTDYGFEGYPMRKCFPLTGYTEVRWSEEEKRVVHEPVQLTQAFRMFDYQSPWEQVGPGVSTDAVGEVKK